MYIYMTDTTESDVRVNIVKVIKISTLYFLWMPISTSVADKKLVKTWPKEFNLYEASICRYINLYTIT